MVKVGDKIRVTKMQDYEKIRETFVLGKEYEVVSFFRLNGMPEVVTEDGHVCYLNEDQYEVVENSREVKVGDTIKLKELVGLDRKLGFVLGGTYEVVGVGDLGFAQVLGKEGRERDMLAFQYDIVENNKEEGERVPEFKAGDIIRSLTNDMDVTKGNHYQVLEVDEEDVRIIDDAGDNYYLSFEEIELVNGNTEREIQVGDTVEYITDERYYFTKGSHYEVESIDSDGDYEVRDDDGDLGFLRPHEVKLVELAEEQEEQENQKSNEYYGVIKFTGLTQEQIKFYINSANMMLDQLLTALDENGQRVEFDLLNEEGAEELKNTDLDI